MSDLISRKATIDAISAVFPVDQNKSEYASGIACGAALALTYIKQLPSAQPHGKWILDTFQIRCNRCNKLFSDNLFPSKYCPNCGSRMDGESDGI